MKDFRLFGWASGSIFFSLMSCQNKPVETLSLELEGQRIYEAHCSSCHHQNPSQDHVLGPAVSGSSLELLEARILRAQYPETYQPKRATRIMLKMPALKPKIGALHAFLNSVGREVQHEP